MIRGAMAGLPAFLLLAARGVTFAQQRVWFGYNPSAPLDYREKPLSTANGVGIHDWSCEVSRFPARIGAAAAETRFAKEC
jgi:hypothetical protein